MEALATASSVAQLFLIVAIGWLVANRFAATIGATPQFWGALSRLVYTIGIPAMTIDLMVGFQWRMDHLWFTLAGIITSLLNVAGSAAIGALASGTQYGKTFAGIAMRNNAGFMGIPLITAVLGPTALPLNALFLFYDGVIGNLASLKALANHHLTADEVSQADEPVPTPSLWKDPLIVSLIIGAVVSFFPQSAIPTLIRTPLKMLSAMTPPLALLIIGARLTFQWDISTVAAIGVSLYKLVASPLLAAGVCWAIGLGGVERAVLVLLWATPVALVTILLTEKHGGDSRLTANAISLSTVVSLLTLTVVAMLVKP